MANIIWRDDTTRDGGDNPPVTLKHPHGDIKITSVVKVNGDYHIWYTPAQQSSDEDRIRDAMAEAHEHPGRTITR